MYKYIFIVLFFSFSTLYSSEYNLSIKESELNHEIEMLTPRAWLWSDEDNKDNEKTKNSFDLKKVMELEVLLSKQIFEQDLAVKTTANSLVCYAAGVSDPQKPIASLLYAGPTGVGKTQLVKTLASLVFKKEAKLLRFNMQEYSEHSAVTGLIGSPYGYADSDKGGRLSNALLENPYSIVLLDEIEKAHEKVKMLFLSIFDEGQFYDAHGTLVDCRNCIIIATTNCGAEEILKNTYASYDKIVSAIEPRLMKELSPELYNRLELVIFRGLSIEALKHIAIFKLDELSKFIHKKKQITVSFDESVLTYLINNSYNPKLGARPLERLIKNDLTSLIAKTLLKGEYKSGDRMTVHYKDSLVIRKETRK
jgi:ATP-dependent Clp protease ATP-binding subunit ClpB